MECCKLFLCNKIAFAICTNFSAIRPGFRLLSCDGRKFENGITVYIYGQGIARAFDDLHARFPGFASDLGFLAVALEYYSDAAMAHGLYSDGAPCTPAERKRRLRLGVRGASVLERTPLVRE